MTGSHGVICRQSGKIDARPPLAVLIYTLDFVIFKVVGQSCIIAQLKMFLKIFL